MHQLRRTRPSIPRKILSVITIWFQTSNEDRKLVANKVFKMKLVLASEAIGRGWQATQAVLLVFYTTLNRAPHQQLTHSTWKGKLMSLIFPIQMIFSQHLHHDERSQDRPPFFRFVAFSRIFRCTCSEKLGLQGCPGSRHLNSILQIYNFRE